MRIDYSKLRRVKGGTAGIRGVVDTYLPQARLYFRTVDGSLHEEKLGEIFVLGHAQKIRRKRGSSKDFQAFYRDFPNRYKVILDRASERVTITDEVIPYSS